MAADLEAQQRVAAALEEVSSHGGPSPGEHEHLGAGPSDDPLEWRSSSCTDT